MMLRKILIPLLLSILLALPVYAVKTEGPDPVPAKEKISSPKARSDKAKSDKAKSDKAKSDLAKSDLAKSDIAKSDKAKSDKPKSERVIVIRTAKDPKVNQVKFGEKGEILVPQSAAIAAIAGAASGAKAGGAEKSADEVGLKTAESEDTKGDKEESTPVKTASSTSGSSDSKGSGSTSNTAGDGGFLGGGTPSGFTGGDAAVALPGNSGTVSGSVSTSGTLPAVPIAQLQALLTRSVSDDGVPGAIMAVQTTAGVWVGAAGKADVAANLPMATDMQVRIGGLTKVFTASLIMQLAESKVLTLGETGDTVEDWLPFTVISGNEITLEMLLNHTSGLHDHETTPEFVDSLSWNPTFPWTNDDVIWIIDMYPLDFVPGTAYTYCNSGYYILGMVAEAALQDTVENAVKARFFGPLGMSRSALTRGGFKTAPTSKDYCYYGPPDAAELIDASTWDFGYDWTSGSGVSTAQDMLTWTNALFKSVSVVSAESLQQMTSAKAPATDYGFGLEVAASDPWFGEKMYGHSSESPGVLTRWYYYPNSGRTIFLFLNRFDKRFGGDIPMAPPQVDASKVADDILSEVSSILTSVGQ